MTDTNKTTHYERLLAAGRAADEDMGEDLTGLTPEQMVKKLSVEYDDMTDEQKRIVDAGQQIAGAFPQGLSREDLTLWIGKNLVGIGKNPVTYRAEDVPQEFIDALERELGRTNLTNDD